MSREKGLWLASGVLLVMALFLWTTRHFGVSFSSTSLVLLIVVTGGVVIFLITETARRHRRISRGLDAASGKAWVTGVDLRSMVEVANYRGFWKQLESDFEDLMVTISAKNRGDRARAVRDGISDLTGLNDALTEFEESQVRREAAQSLGKARVQQELLERGNDVLRRRVIRTGLLGKIRKPVRNTVGESNVAVASRVIKELIDLHARSPGARDRLIRGMDRGVSEVIAADAKLTLPPECLADPGVLRLFRKSGIRLD